MTIFLKNNLQIILALRDDEKKMSRSRRTIREFCAACELYPSNRLKLSKIGTWREQAFQRYFHAFNEPSHLCRSGRRVVIYKILSYMLIT